MDRFRELLLDVWREACRHIEIGESTETLAGLLATHMPLAAVVVRRLDGEHSLLDTVGLAHCIGAQPPARFPAATTLRKADHQRLIRSARRAPLVHRAESPDDPLWHLLLPGQTSDAVAVILGTADTPTGVLLLLAAGRRAFDEHDRALAAALREPITVALENDRRLHEMATLREAAEADRRSLLRRLGRDEIVDSIVGAESGLQHVIERVDLVARSDVPALILGETGTGKEVIARLIHTNSPRSGGPFIRVNCGAIPSELIDSQLFGHERGSFTGATESRKGWFERADTGTLLLDEIGELPLPAQVRLLRVLQDGFIERVGGHQPIRIDVRIVAATHRDLAAMVRDGRFREDLWYRVAVFPILLPPLRERRQDIPALARHFAERAAKRFGLPPALPTQSDLILLERYPWPGNIRELGAVIDRAAILGEGRSLEVSKALGTSPPMGGAPADVAPPRQELADAEREGFLTLDRAMARHIEAALSHTKGRVEGPGGAAALLGINPHTLRARMRKLGIRWERFRA